MFKSRLSYLVDELAQVVFVQHHDTGHEVIVVYVDFQRLCHFVELAADRVLGVGHHSHHLAYIFLEVNPNCD